MLLEDYTTWITEAKEHWEKEIRTATNLRYINKGLPDMNLDPEGPVSEPPDWVSGPNNKWDCVRYNSTNWVSLLDANNDEPSEGGSWTEGGPTYENADDLVTSAFSQIEATEDQFEEYLIDGGRKAAFKELLLSATFYATLAKAMTCTVVPVGDIYGLAGSGTFKNMFAWWTEEIALVYSGLFSLSGYSYQEPLPTEHTVYTDQGILTSGTVTTGILSEVIAHIATDLATLEGFAPQVDGATKDRMVYQVLQGPNADLIPSGKSPQDVVALDNEEDRSGNWCGIEVAEFFGWSIQGLNT